MPELALVIPTFNEAKNIAPLLELLDKSLAGILWEAVFVDDDSPDGTADLLRIASQKDPRVRVIQRIGRRGLSSACIEGMMSTAAPYIAVMDADLQHDERLLPAMLQRMRAGDVDVVVASRNVEGGSMGEFSALRVWISNTGKALSRLACKVDLSDPMSGFFLLRRGYLEGAVRQTSSLGFKILVDLLASSPAPARIAELPYTFRQRQHGESKLDTNVLLDYVFLIADKTVGHFLPVRLVLFGLAGLSGAVVNFLLLWLGRDLLDLSFDRSQLIGILSAMTVNFFVNNLVTFRDRRRKGWGIVTGLLTFYLACGAGAFSNYALSSFCFQNGMSWWLAGLTGLIVGGVWNYGVTSLLTWRSQRRPKRA